MDRHLERPPAREKVSIAEHSSVLRYAKVRQLGQLVVQVVRDRGSRNGGEGVKPT